MYSSDTIRPADEEISAERVRRSVFFASALKRAADYLRRPGRLSGLADRAWQKFLYLPGPLSELRETLSACLRLLRAWAGGGYREIPSSSLVSIVAALIYFVAPVDLVPDFILGLGLVDDAALLGWVVSSLRRDLERFAAWEIEQHRATREVHSAAG